MSNLKTLIERDRAYTWHPFTQHEVEPDPIPIVRAKNASLFDVEGREILDLISSWWTCLHGHSHGELNEALAAQAERLPHIMFAGFTHAPAVELAEALVAGTGNSVSELGAAAESERGNGVVNLPDTRTPMTIAVERHVAPGRNIVAMVEGSDPAMRDEVVIIGAHHDHNGADGNVIFNGEDLPGHAISSQDVDNAVELWRGLEEACTGDCDFLTIPHNMNKGWGLFYSRHTWDGGTYAEGDWRLRMRREPLAEMYQVKGASECALGVGATPSGALCPPHGQRPSAQNLLQPWPLPHRWRRHHPLPNSTCAPTPAGASEHYPQLPPNLRGRPLGSRANGHRHRAIGPPAEQAI